MTCLYIEERMEQDKRKYITPREVIEELWEELEADARRTMKETEQSECSKDLYLKIFDIEDQLFEQLKYQHKNLDEVYEKVFDVSYALVRCMDTSWYKYENGDHEEEDDDDDNDDDDDDNNKVDADNSNTKDNIIRAAAATGFCPKTFPKYISSIEEFVSETVQYLVPAIFADFNMAYYPPGPDTALFKACAIFQQDDKTANPMKRLNQFFELRGKVEYGTTDSSDNDNEESPSCFDLSLELPDGPNSKIRGSDNSGTGGGHAGEIWEFQCCKDLIIRAGYSERSMFLPRHFSYEWHENHCKERFPGIIVEPYRMNQQWGFDQLTKDKTSHIVFTNGMNDGWSTSSITNTTEMADPSKYHDIVVIDFPNGAHHSDLKAGVYPNPNDTADILEGYKQATKILSAWLDEIYSLQQ